MHPQFELQTCERALSYVHCKALCFECAYGVQQLLTGICERDTGVSTTAETVFC